MSAAVPDAIRYGRAGGCVIMELAGKIQPIVALIAGVLILIRPELLNLIVAVYLIYVGVVGLMHSGMVHM